MSVFPFDPDLSSSQTRLGSLEPSQKNASLESGGVKPVVHTASEMVDPGFLEIFLRIQNHLFHGFLSELYRSPSMMGVLGCPRRRMENGQIASQCQKEKT